MRSCLVVLAAVLAGCLVPEDDVAQWTEDFEGCGLCTWWLASGRATVVTTVHPGEHAAQLEPGAVLRHALGVRRVVDPDPAQGWDRDESFSDGNWIEYSTDCAGRPALLVRAVDDVTFDVELALTGPAEPAFARRHLTFPPLPAQPAPPPGSEPVELTFRELSLTSAGRCRIDNLRVMVSGGTLGY